MIQPFVVPEKERVVLLKSGNFIVINSLSHSIDYSTSSTTIRRVQCPRCGNSFTQSGTFGCFGGYYDKSTCDCGFPWKRDDSIKSDSLRSTGQSGDGSGGGEEEADEDCPSGRPLGNSPNINGGLVEDLDPGLQSILKHRKRS